MKTQNVKQAARRYNKTLAIYIASVSAFMVTYSVFAAIQYL